MNQSFHLFTSIVAIFLFPPLLQAGVGKKAVDKAFNPPKIEKPKKKKEKIPIKINVGFSLSQYRLFDAYNNGPNNEERTPSIFGTELSLSGVVEQKTIKRFENKIPPKFRKLALSFSEVSATTMYIPRSIYIQPRNSSGIEAYGATWGFVPALGIGPSFLSLNLGGGPILTYLHYRDFNQPDPVHFIRPGLRGVISLRMPMFWNNFVLEVGGKGDIYVPQKFYADNKSLWNIRSIFAQVHFRFPTIIEAKI